MRVAMLVLDVRGGKGMAFFFSRAGRKPRLSSFREFEAEGGNPSEEFISSLKGARISKVFLLLPAEEAVFKRISLPLKDEEKISKVLRFEAEKFLPYPAEDAAIAFAAAGGDKQSTEIFAAAARKATAGAFSGFLKDAGMKPAAVVPELACIPALEGGKDCFMFIGGDEAKLKICIYKDGFPHTAGLVRAGGPAEALREAERLLGVFSLKEPEASVGHVSAAGWRAEEAGRAVSEKFGIGFRGMDALSVINHDLSENGAREIRGRCEEAAALAAAVFSGAKPLDLAEGKKRPSRLESPVFAAVLGFFILLFLSSYAFTGLGRKQSELDSINAEIEATVSEVFGAPELAGRSGMELVSILRERVSGGGGAREALKEIGSGDCLEVLRELSLRFPDEDGMSVSGIRLDGRVCAVDGRAGSLSMAERAVKSIRESDYFEGAVLAGAQADGERGVVSFRIQVELPREGRR